MAVVFNVWLLLATCPSLITSLCPFVYEGTPPSGRAPVPNPELYEQALAQLNLANVLSDIEDLLVDSKQCWPADEFNNESNYGPLFIRLAWHCSGTFRSTDGVGGCSGGRQRFPPEASWDDNTNLDKARALLAPIKHKYGIGLSWGDLMTLAGTAAIINMGGPVDSICAGRIDDENGNLSQPLGILYIINILFLIMIIFLYINIKINQVQVQRHHHVQLRVIVHRH